MTTPLFTGFTQHAYVTTDIDRAQAVFAENYGVSKFLTMRDIPYGNGRALHIALAYAGNAMIELIQPIGDIPLYQETLPARGFALRFHHLGHFLDSEAEWQDILAQVKAKKMKIAVEGDAGGLKYLYVDLRDSLDHFVEYVYHGSLESQAMLAGIPRN